MSQASKVLIIQTAFLGDAVLITSLLEKIRVESPSSTIHLLVRKGLEGIFKAYPHDHLGQVWTYDKSNKLKSWWTLRNELTKEKFDQVFVAQRFFGMGLLSISISAKKVVGFDKNPLSMFFDEKVTHEFGHGKHETERNTQLLASWLGPQVHKPFLNASYLNKFPVDLHPQKYVSISPGSVWETKRFPVHKWIEFIRLLPLDQEIVLMGSASEKHLSDEIENALEGSGRHIHNDCGRFNLQEAIAVYQQSLMSFVNDSGPLHICSALNTPTVAIFCSTIPAFGFGPLAERHKIIQVKEKLACRPCGDHGKKSCPEVHFNCANSIDVQEMFQAYQTFLASGSK
jgi:heptosyltransferase-2